MLLGVSMVCVSLYVSLESVPGKCLCMRLCVPGYVSLECVCVSVCVPGYVSLESVSVYVSLECVPGMCVWYASLWTCFSGLRVQCSLLCA